VTSKLDINSINIQRKETIIERGKIPEFEQLINFLNQRSKTLEAASRLSKTSDSSSKTAPNKGITAYITITKNTFCQKENHAIYKCKDFLDLSIDQRIKEEITHIVFKLFKSHITYSKGVYLGNVLKM